jgi:cytidylate kinase
MVDVISVDGPSGSGKTTAARGVAQVLGCKCLETGGLYRAVALAVLRSGLDPAAEQAVRAHLRNVRLSAHGGRTILGGEDVTELLRDQDVTAAVSVVAQQRAVRQFVTDFIRHWAKRNGPRCVVEGRDIGTEVFPQAMLKVFMFADPAVRAQREVGGEHLDSAEQHKRTALRDEVDRNRTLAPLRRTADMYEIDTTYTVAPEPRDRILKRLSEIDGGRHRATPNPWWRRWTSRLTTSRRRGR